MPGFQLTYPDDFRILMFKTDDDWDARGYAFIQKIDPELKLCFLAKCLFYVMSIFLHVIQYDILETSVTIRDLNAESKQPDFYYFHEYELSKIFNNLKIDLSNKNQYLKKNYCIEYAIKKADVYITEEKISINLDRQSIYLEYINYYVLKMMLSNETIAINDDLKTNNISNENDIEVNYNFLKKNNFFDMEGERIWNSDDTKDTWNFKLWPFYNIRNNLFDIFVVYQYSKKYEKIQMPDISKVTDEKYNAAFYKYVHEKICFYIEMILAQHKKLLDAFSHESYNWQLIQTSDVMGILNTSKNREIYAKDKGCEKLVSEIETAELNGYDTLSHREFAEMVNNAWKNDKVLEELKQKFDANKDDRIASAKYFSRKDVIRQDTMGNLRKTNKKKCDEILQFATRQYENEQAERFIKLINLKQILIKNKMFDVNANLGLKRLDEINKMIDGDYYSFLNDLHNELAIFLNKTSFLIKNLTFERSENIFNFIKANEWIYKKIKAKSQLSFNENEFIIRYSFIASIANNIDIFNVLHSMGKISNCIGYEYDILDLESDVENISNTINKYYNDTNVKGIANINFGKFIFIAICSKEAIKKQNSVDNFEYYTACKNMTKTNEYFYLRYKNAYKLLVHPNYTFEMPSEGVSGKIIRRSPILITGDSYILNSGGISNKKILSNELGNIGLTNVKKDNIFITSGYEQQKNINNSQYVYNASVLENMLFKICTVARRNNDQDFASKHKEYLNLKMSDRLAKFADACDKFIDCAISNKTSVKTIMFERHNEFSSCDVINTNTVLRTVTCKIDSCELSCAGGFAFLMDNNKYAGLNCSEDEKKYISAYLNHYFVFNDFKQGRPGGPKFRDIPDKFIYDVYAYDFFKKDNGIEKQSAELITALEKILPDRYFNIDLLKKQSFLLQLCKYVFNLSCVVDYLNPNIVEHLKTSIRSMYLSQDFKYLCQEASQTQNPLFYNSVKSILIRSICFYIDIFYQTALINGNIANYQLILLADPVSYNKIKPENEGMPCVLQHHDFFNAMELCNKYVYKNVYHMLIQYMTWFPANECSSVVKECWNTMRLCIELLGIINLNVSQKKNTFNHLKLYMTPTKHPILNVFQAISHVLLLKNYESQSDVHRDKIEKVVSNILMESASTQKNMTKNYKLNSVKDKSQGLNLDGIVQMINSYGQQFSNKNVNLFEYVCREMNKKNTYCININSVHNNKFGDLTYFNLKGSFKSIFELFSFETEYIFKNSQSLISVNQTLSVPKQTGGGDPIYKYDQGLNYAKNYMFYFVIVLVICLVCILCAIRTNMRYNIQNGQYIHAAPRFRTNCAGSR